MVHLDVRVPVEEAAQRRERRADDVRAGLEGIPLIDVWPAEERDADLGDFHGLAAADGGLGEGEVAAVAVGALPIQRELARGAGAGTVQVLKGADRGEFLAVDLIDDGADAEGLGEGGIFG